MKRVEKIFLAVFAAILLGALGIVLSLDSREPSAKIRFTEAHLSTNGNLTLDYFITQSSQTLLQRTESVDGHAITGMQAAGSGSWLGFPIHSGGGERINILRSGTGSAPLRVRTGITYIVTFTNHLILYDFTNSEGVHYQADFRIEKL